MRVADVLDRFPPVRGHLDAATSGVPPLASIAAARDAVTAWAEGLIDGPSYDDAVEGARTEFARLVGVDRADVACGSQASAFAGLVAAQLPAGAEVLVARGDFTSVVFPMYAQEPRGVRVREVELDRLPEAIEARTTLVAVSAVQSADGRVLDLDALARALRDAGYDGPMCIESFTAANEVIATAASIWRPLAPSPDALAADGLAFLRLLSTGA